MRNLQIAKEIKKIVSQIFITNIQQKIKCLIFINNVCLNKNLTLAKIYYTIFGNKKNIINAFF